MISLYFTVLLLINSLIFGSDAVSKDYFDENFDENKNCKEQEKIYEMTKSNPGSCAHKTLGSMISLTNLELLGFCCVFSCNSNLRNSSVKSVCKQFV